jgi:hypothetical protein
MNSRAVFQQAATNVLASATAPSTNPQAYPLGQEARYNIYQTIASLNSVIFPEIKASEKSFRAQDFKSLGHSSTSVLESRPLSRMKEKAPARIRLTSRSSSAKTASLSRRAHQSAPPNKASYVSISFAGMPAARRLSSERQPPLSRAPPPPHPRPLAQPIGQ